MKQTPRDYQERCLLALEDAQMAGYKRILYTQATGTGKTTVIAEVTDRCIRANCRVLVLAHRTELIQQAYNRIQAHCDLDEWEIGVEKAGERAAMTNLVVIGSKDTVQVEGRLNDWRPDVIITDEAHRAAAAGYRKIYERFGVTRGECLHIGCSIGPESHLCVRHTNGSAEVVTIGELADRYQVGADEKCRIDGLSIQTIDEYGHLVWSPLSHIWRFTNHKRTLNLRTELGRELIVTDDHSVFCVGQDGGLCLKPSGDLHVGDYLIAEPSVNLSDDLPRMNAKRLMPGLQATALKIKQITQCQDITDVYDLSIPGVERFFANNFLVHNTATAKRLDKQGLYARKPDGTPVMMLDEKTKKKVPANPDDCVFEILCFEYGLLDAIEDGWSVPIRGWVVESDMDLSDLKTRTNAEGETDFIQKQLADKIAGDNEEALERTKKAINYWKKVAVHRPTIAFCVNVEHAHHSAQLWREAGFSAVAVDGETDSTIRACALEDFRQGRIQVLCNCGLYTEGTDIPSCSCITMLKPTASWALFCQMAGRGNRVLPGVVDGLATAAERKRAIAASAKGDCLIIDVVDKHGRANVERHNLCTAPSLLDLRPDMDLQGHSISEAKRLLDQFDDSSDKGRVVGACPTTFEDLEVKCREINMLDASGAKCVNRWAVAENGWTFVNPGPNYAAQLVPAEDGWFRLIVWGYGQKIYDRKSKPGKEFKDYLDTAAEGVTWAITRDRKRRRPPLTELYKPNVLWHYQVRLHMRDEQIYAMSPKEAHDKLRDSQRDYRAQKAAGEEAKKAAEEAAAEQVRNRYADSAALPM